MNYTRCWGLECLETNRCVLELVENPWSILERKINNSSHSIQECWMQVFTSIRTTLFTSMTTSTKL
jgi:hypothetical protein